jgi:hypothetical protein
MNSLSRFWPEGYQGMKHMGFGEFSIELPDGTEIEFDRMRGKDFPGKSGRSHKVYDNKGGKAVKKMIELAEKKNASELVSASFDDDEIDAELDEAVASDWAAKEKQLDAMISKVVEEAWNLLTRKQYTRVMIWYVPAKGPKWGQLFADHPDNKRPTPNALPIQGLTFMGADTKQQMFRKLKEATRRLPLLGVEAAVSDDEIAAELDEATAGMRTATETEFQRVANKANQPPRHMFYGKPDTGRGGMDVIFKDRGTEIAHKSVTYKRGKEESVMYMINPDYL